MSRLNGTKKFALILATIFLASTLIAGVIYAVQYGRTGIVGDKIKLGGDQAKFNFDEEKSSSINGIESISIDGVQERIKVITSDSPEVQSHFYGTCLSSDPNYKPTLTMERKGNKLLIKVSYKSSKPSINLFYIGIQSELNLDIQLPSNFKGDLGIQSTSGDIQADALSLKSLQCDSVSGDIRAQQLSTELARFESTSGDITADGSVGKFVSKTVSGSLRAVGLTASTSIFESTSGEIVCSGNPGNVKASSISGNIELACSETKPSVDIETTSGDVSLRMPEDSNFSLDFETTSGSSESAFPIMVSGNRNDHSLKGTIGTGEGSIQVSSVSGNLNLLKR